MEVSPLKASYDRIIIRPQINRALASELQDAGIPFFEREDLPSIKEPGMSVFGPDGEPTVTLSSILDDIGGLGLVLSHINLLYVESVRRRYLYMVFGEGRIGVGMSRKAQKLILEKVLGRVYTYMHVYVNPDGAATVNPVSTGIFDHDSPVRDLRITTSGDFFIE